MPAHATVRPRRPASAVRPRTGARRRLRCRNGRTYRPHLRRRPRPDERWRRIEAEAARLEAAGGRVIARFDGHHVMMADPEGNEFCVGAGPAAAG
ncbi:VOC family protein [Streptomyces sp. NPDC049040]|uniref:VOC family protein n=1 Tax=Streptomyces sp. NPDC049040 TaxID=3365593 RepID=UPI003723B250